MAKKKLRPGKGAQSQVLTRFIKPTQPLPGNDKKHRSTVVLTDRDHDKAGKVVFRFRYETADGDNATLLYANHRYVQMIKEGDPNDLFDGPGEPQKEEEKHKEPKIKWKKSKARALLYEDVKKNVVIFDDNNKPVMSLEEIYTMHEEYAEYRFDKFKERLKSIRKIVVEMDSRAEADKLALEQYISKHPISYSNWKGLMQWQGSGAQEAAKEDIANNMVQNIGYRQMYDNRSVYHQDFPFDDFRDKIRQEVRTGKYLHTLKVKGMQHQSS
jgi:hypothetical protein